MRESIGNAMLYVKKFMALMDSAEKCLFENVIYQATEPAALTLGINFSHPVEFFSRNTALINTGIQY